MMIWLIPMISRSKTKWYKHTQKNRFRLTTRDLSNFVKPWSNTHFVSFLFFFDNIWFKIADSVWFIFVLVWGRNLAHLNFLDVIVGGFQMEKLKIRFGKCIRFFYIARKSLKALLHFSSRITSVGRGINFHTSLLGWGHS